MDEHTIGIYIERTNSVSASCEEDYLRDTEKLLKKLQEELFLDDLISIF